MGKVPVRLKEVVYTVSPFEVTVLSGLFKDMPKKFAEKVKHVSLPHPSRFYMLRISLH